MSGNGQVKYSVAALHPNDDLSSDNLIRIADCPPRSRGGPQVYCPICGQRFVSHGNPNKVWFQHYGENGSYRTEFLDWPEQTSGESWDNVRNRVNGWWFHRIHKELGYDANNPNSSSPSEIMSEERRKRNQQFARPQIPIQLHKDGNQWRVFAVANHDESGSPIFQVENTEAYAASSETYYTIEDLSLPVTIKWSNRNESEEISFPIDTQTAMILIDDGPNMWQGTLSHPRFRWNEIGHGSYYRRDLNGQVIIANGKYRRYKRMDQPLFRIALPTIKGTIPWLEENHTIPVDISEEGRNNLTLVSSILGDTEPWHIQGDVYLNADHYRGRGVDVRPAVELRQTGHDNRSHRSIISLYPAFRVPRTGVSRILIDGEGFNPRSVCYVDDLPSTIVFQTAFGEELDLNNNRCIVLFSCRMGSSVNWSRIEGELDAVLTTMRTQQIEEFAISIIPNSRRDLWDWIQVSTYRSTVTQTTQRIEPAIPRQRVQSPRNISLNGVNYKLNRQLRKRLTRAGPYADMDQAVFGFNEQDYVDLLAEYQRI
jgi:hypothetical protein